MPSREMIEREPLILGLMFPQGQGAWTASFEPTETTIEWSFLSSLAQLADRLGLDYLFMGNGYYTKGGYGGYGRTRAAALDATAVAAALAPITKRLLLISTIHTAYAVNYLRERRRTSDPFIQHHTAEAKIMLVTAELLLAETAELYRIRRYPQAFDYSRMLRAYSQTAMQRVIELVQASCGSSIYMDPGPVSRIMRDWQFYCRHENLDLILTAAGKTIFGLGGEGNPQAFGFGRSEDRSAAPVRAGGGEK